jgi:hypothetical protein
MNNAYKIVIENLMGRDQGNLSADGGIINAIKINVKEIVCAGVESIYLN